MPQLLSLFPTNIDTYIEPFFGGGSSMMNVAASNYSMNDIDNNVVALHNFLLSFSNKKEKFFKELFSMINRYGFSCSYLKDVIPQDLKKKYPKTYYAKFNKAQYKHLKDDFNREGKTDYLKLYLLLIYGFNHMIRFNSSGDFNLPVGNVDFNKNVYEALNNYFDITSRRVINVCSLDFEQFLRAKRISNNDFVYLDPPYLISLSEYNKLWGVEDEQRLYNLLDSLNEKGIKFGITNLLKHKGKTNELFQKFSSRYKSVIIKSNYISFNDNTIKDESVELFVFNY